MYDCYMCVTLPPFIAPCKYALYCNSIVALLGAHNSKPVVDIHCTKRGIPVYARYRGGIRGLFEMWHWHIICWDKKIQFLFHVKLNSNNIMIVENRILLYLGTSRQRLLHLSDNTPLCPPDYSCRCYLEKLQFPTHLYPSECCGHCHSLLIIFTFCLFLCWGIYFCLQFS